MLERQNDSGDKFSAVEEETPFTPHVSFLSREDCIAYTLPFQQIELDPLNSLQRSVPLLNDDGQILATLHTIALFIPYALRKPYGVRPPLMAHGGHAGRLTAPATRRGCRESRRAVELQSSDAVDSPP